MRMTLCTLLAIACCFGIAAHNSANGIPSPEQQSGQDQQDERTGIVIHQNGTEQACQAMAYSFCIEMRDKRREGPQTGEKAAWFRNFIDPQYLAEHNLTEGDLPLMTLPFREVRDIRVSDDLETAYCVVTTEDQGTEVFLFRFINDGAEPYARYHFRPANPPDEQTGFIEPWVLWARVPAVNE